MIRFLIKKMGNKERTQLNYTKRSQKAKRNVASVFLYAALDTRVGFQRNKDINSLFQVFSNHHKTQGFV